MKTNKNDTTLALEQQLRRNISKVGVFICGEVTIGFNQKKPERVDILSIDTKGIIRCYEVKSSVSDFRSKAKWTFIGHYNYFCMPEDIYEKVKTEIPSHVGVYVYGTCVKKPKKQEVPQEMLQTVMMSMIRSLSRDAEKLHKSENPRIIEQYETQITRLKNENHKLRYPKRYL